jgi:plastocyanin
MKTFLASLTATTILAAVAAPSLAAGKTVKVGDDFFRARTVRVAPGATVTWKWVGGDGHNVVGKGFRSSVRNRGTFKHRFTKRGTFGYVCTLHAEDGMRGTVIVG